MSSADNYRYSVFVLKLLYINNLFVKLYLALQMHEKNDFVKVSKNLIRCWSENNFAQSSIKSMKIIMQDA